MPIFSPERALMWIKKTPTIMRATLSGVTQARATGSRDGEAGWNVLEIICHLNDYEQIYIDRLRTMLTMDTPQFTGYDADQLVTQNQYDAQQFDQVLTSWTTRRAQHILLLEGLTPEQWQRKGIHPTFGEMTIIEATLSTTLHDVNHLEQIVRVLGLNT